jgi:hypothetical protein
MMAKGAVAEPKKGCYRCRCGKTLAVEDYHRTMGPEHCPISPTGRHSYVYIYPDGHTATGAKYS